jgi:hypothetical protein
VIDKVTKVGESSQKRQRSGSNGELEPKASVFSVQFKLSRNWDTMLGAKTVECLSEN